MKLLVELGADPLAEQDGTPLMVAAGLGSQAPEERPATRLSVSRR